MSTHPDTTTLEKILDHVRGRHHEYAKAERAFFMKRGAQLPPLDTSWIDDAVEECRQWLPAFLVDQSDKSAEELEELASHLAPGGAHTSGWLADEIFQLARWEVDQLLLAATIRYSWHGGKAGFQFLPDPAKADPDEYEEQVQELVGFLFDATGGNPTRILTGDDFDFYNSLPDRFTVYRGCSGISPELGSPAVSDAILINAGFKIHEQGTVANLSLGAERFCDASRVAVRLGIKLDHQ